MKRVIFDSSNVISYKEVCTEQKIYAFKSYTDIYKLHRIQLSGASEKFAWISLGESICYANGLFDNVQTALLGSKDSDIFEFDNLKEFANWISEN